MLKKNTTQPYTHCLKCQYQELFDQGKNIFDNWDQSLNPPKELLIVQKKLLKLRKKISKDNADNSFKFCSKHPDVFELIPVNWL